jgi:hypothetical protein
MLVEYRGTLVASALMILVSKLTKFSENILFQSPSFWEGK